MAFIVGYEIVPAHLRECADFDRPAATFEPAHLASQPGSSQADGILREDIRIDSDARFLRRKVTRAVTTMLAFAICARRKGFVQP